MKQNKLKTLALVLALALILTLAVGMLAACNANDDPTRDSSDANDDSSDDVSELISQEQFYALAGCLYSADFNEIETDIISLSAAMTNANLNMSAPNATTKNGAIIVFLFMYGNLEEDRKQVQLAFVSSAKEATAFLEDMESVSALNGFEQGNYHAQIYGNVAVLETEKGWYEDHIVKATLPSTVSAARKQMLEEMRKSFLSEYYGESHWTILKENASQKTPTAESIGANFTQSHGHCIRGIGYRTVDSSDVAMEKARWEKQKNFYTNDSYFNTTKEQGYIFEEYTYKPGFVYEETGTNQVKITDYFYTEEELENFTVPAQIDGKKVAGVELKSGWRHNFLIKNITIEEGITSLSLETDVLQSVNLPASLTDLHISSTSLTSLTLPATVKSADLYCKNLTTIHYDGNKADFEKTFSEREVNYWCCVEYYDPATQQMNRDVITIHIVCDDGTLTYPTEEIEF